MTYCVAIRLEAGLVLASDSRTSAGVDDISVYSKMHRFRTAGDRRLVLLSAGNLATTQAVRNRIHRDLSDPQAERNLDTLAHLDEIADYIGDISADVQEGFSGQSEQNDGVMEASFILGGQIGDQPHDIFLVYPQGNYIAASPDKPFLQVGETKYGKPILDRIVAPSIGLERAGRCALISMDAAMRSNLTVGPPIELLFLGVGEHSFERHCRFGEDDPWLRDLSRAWADGLTRVFMELPRFEWEQAD